MNIFFYTLHKMEKYSLFSFVSFVRIIFLVRTFFSIPQVCLQSLARTCDRFGISIWQIHLIGYLSFIICNLRNKSKIKNKPGQTMLELLVHAQEALRFEFSAFIVVNIDISMYVYGVYRRNTIDDNAYLYFCRSSFFHCYTKLIKL